MEKYVVCRKCGDEVPESAISKTICLQCLEENTIEPVWTGESKDEDE